MAPNLTEDQIAEYRQVFAFFDRNGDGVITIEEMAEMLKVLGKHPSNEELTQIMRQLKGHETTTIDFEDFLKFFEGTEQLEQDTEMLREVFQVFDQDSDGFITTNELRRVMLQLGEILTDDELKAMIEEADTDGDGQINFEEFVNIMRGDESPLPSRTNPQ